MGIQELSTCLQYKTPVKIVSLNKRYLGMVAQVAGDLTTGGRYSTATWMRCRTFVKTRGSVWPRCLKVEKP